MPSLDSEGKFVPGTFEQEADRAWANIIAIAAASGYTSDEFLYVQMILADIVNYGDINDWWRRQFPDPAAAPSRLTFQAGALPFGAKIELQAVAAHGRVSRQADAARLSRADKLRPLRPDLDVRFNRWLAAGRHEA
jgi:2-iminobutanoate/2-iminopropanoate deaminase